MSKMKMICQHLQKILTRKCQCCPHIETSQLICKVNQLTVFYMRTPLALNGLNKEVNPFKKIKTQPLFDR